MTAKPLRGIHVLGWLGAFFAATFVVDGYFIMSAVNTFPGEQVRNSYVLGLDFNRQIARRTAQERLGWTAEAGLIAGPEPVLLVRLDAPDGPVSGLRVDVEAVLPGRGVQALHLVERASGEYVAPLAIAETHRVELAIKAFDVDETLPTFEAFKTIERPS